jgi:hypothetical protein
MGHGPDVAPGIQLDGFAGLDLYCNAGLGFWADMIGADGPKGLQQVHAAVQAEDLFLCIPNGEFASSLDVVGTGQV